MKRKGIQGASASAQPAEADSPALGVPDPRWTFPTRVAFRFTLAYLGLYALLSQVFGGMFLAFVSSPPNYAFRSLGHLWPMREFTFWVASRALGAEPPIVYAGNSGDSIFYWAQSLWILLAAAAAAAVWTAADRGRKHYFRLHQWFRLFMRVALAAQMLYYGMAKVIPTQFPAPPLTTLVTPAGNLSLQGLLWVSIGAAPGYQIFTGIAEVLAGVLLLIPATATVGAAMSAAVMIEILILNLTYDVGLKQVSFHLLLMSGFLLAPCASRLAGFFLRNRAAEPLGEAPLFKSPQANRAAFAFQLLLLCYFLGMYGCISRSWWYADGGGTPKSALYGIWSVESMSVDGEAQPPVLNDYDRRWRRLIFDAPDSAVFQRTDDSFARYRVAIDLAKQELTLAKGNSRTWRSKFQFRRSSEDRLVLDGAMDDHAIHVELGRVDLDTFRLLNSGFRWVRPPDPGTVVD